MKKLTALFIAILMILATVLSMTACQPQKPKSEVEKAIEAAAKMTPEELLAKAREEIGTNALMIKGISSGFKKIGAAFATKYGFTAPGSPDDLSKDTAVYTAFNAAMEANEYYADVMLLQDTNSLLDQIQQGNLLNYVPNGLTGIVEADKDPLVGIYLNKNFIYLKENASDPATLTNVWQLAGSADDAGHIGKLSFQKPTTEGINMSMLVMLTSPENITKLTTAYKSYYGTDYAGGDGYKNIAYKFIAEFVKNVTTWHTSDTTAVKNLGNGTVGAGTIIYAPFNKYKDAEKETPGSTANFTTTGFNSQIAGFNGYLYKMYLQIPNTAKYPYTACLFINYMFTQEAITAGWGGNIGYYSPVTGITTGVSNDLTVATWKANGMLVEDPQFIFDNFEDVSKFVNTEIAKLA